MVKTLNTIVPFNQLEPLSLWKTLLEITRIKSPLFGYFNFHSNEKVTDQDSKNVQTFKNKITSSDKNSAKCSSEKVKNKFCANSMFKFKNLIVFIIFFSIINFTKSEKICFNNKQSDQTCIDIFGLKFDFYDAEQNSIGQPNALENFYYKISSTLFGSIKPIKPYTPLEQYQGVPLIKEFKTNSDPGFISSPNIIFLGEFSKVLENVKLNQKDETDTQSKVYDENFTIIFSHAKGLDSEPIGGNCLNLSNDGKGFRVSDTYSLSLFNNSNGETNLGVKYNQHMTNLVEYEQIQNQRICLCYKQYPNSKNDSECKFLTSKNDFYVMKVDDSQLVTSIIVIFLLCLSGLFSGLNLGLMALDPQELKTLKNAGREQDKKYAAVIEPVRSQGNYLLCTLLLGNTIVNVTLSVFLGDLFQGVLAVAFSTFGIVIFGEIIPQSLCSRHGLRIGANTIWLTKIFMIITWPLSKPISILLDFILGQEEFNTIRKRELLELLKLGDGTNDDQFDNDEIRVIEGLIEIGDKEISDVMTRIQSCYMLEKNSILDFDTIAEIIDSGYTRIPIYDDQKTNVCGLLFVRDLAFVDPDDNTPLKVITDFYDHDVKYHSKDEKCDDVLDSFRQGAYHMAIVYDKNDETVNDQKIALGIVTLEDIIEELIKCEIVDEFDKFVDDSKLEQNPNRQYKGIDQLRHFTNNTSANALSTLGKSSSTNTHGVTPQVLLACHRYMVTDIPVFKRLSSDTVLKMVTKTHDLIHVIDTNAKSESKRTIIKAGETANFFIIILEGYVKVFVGENKMEFDKGPFSHFAHNSLENCFQSEKMQIPLAAEQVRDPSSQSMVNMPVKTMTAIVPKDTKNVVDYIPDFSVIAKPGVKVVYLKIDQQLFMSYLGRQAMQEINLGLVSNRRVAPKSKIGQNLKNSKNMLPSAGSAEVLNNNNSIDEKRNLRANTLPFHDAHHRDESHFGTESHSLLKKTVTDPSHNSYTKLKSPLAQDTLLENNSTKAVSNYSLVDCIDMNTSIEKVDEEKKKVGRRGSITMGHLQRVKMKEEKNNSTKSLNKTHDPPPYDI